MSQVNEFTLSYETPYDWLWMLRFLSLHTSEGVEWIEKTRYVRTMSTRKGTGFIDVSKSDEHDANALTVMISKSLEAETADILRRLKNLFDLDFQPETVLPCLGTLAEQNPGLRVPGAFDNFETSVRVILGQLVSVQSANTFMRRYLQAFGRKFDSSVANLNLITPTATEIAVVDAAEMARLIRVPRKRAEAIVNLAIALTEKRLNLEDKTNPEKTIQMLEAIPGIGPWTAHTLAMRILHWSDAFPHGDLGIRKALNLERKSEILNATEKWQPWRAYATMHLWNSINAIDDKIDLLPAVNGEDSYRT